MGKEGWEGHMPVCVVQEGVNRSVLTWPYVKTRGEWEQQEGGGEIFPEVIFEIEYVKRNRKIDQSTIWQNRNIYINIHGNFKIIKCLTSISGIGRASYKFWKQNNY